MTLSLPGSPCPPAASSFCRAALCAGTRSRAGPQEEMWSGAGPGKGAISPSDRKERTEVMGTRCGRTGQALSTVASAWPTRGAQCEHWPSGTLVWHHLATWPNRDWVEVCPLQLWTPVVSFQKHFLKGVSKIVTVDVKGNSPLWLKVKDLAQGMTYRFRIRAKTFTYGPEIEANVTTGPGEGAPGPPGVPIIVRYSSAIAIHWSSGDPGKGPITRYVIEARPSDEGLWDILIKDIPKEVTSYTFSMDILKPGVSYDFRVIAVNDYGFGTPSSPSQSVPAQKANPFYEEWWFLVVIALVGLIFILLLIFVLIIRGQSKKYAKKTDSGNNAKSGALGHGEMMSLDESSFPALELNNRRLSVKNSFCRKNGLYTRSPPRPSPGSLHYSDEDVTKYNDLIPAESSSLTEKPSEISDSQGSDSEYEADPTHQKAHSFVNHYISDPTYYNSWRRQQKGISRAQAYSYTESDSGEPDHTTIANSSSAQQGGLFRPKASRTPTPQNPPNPPSQQSTLYRPPSSLTPGPRAPIAGFSSFV